MADNVKESVTKSEKSSPPQLTPKDEVTTDSDFEDNQNISDHSQDSDSQDASGSESDPDIVCEREEGDGQESVPAKKVDDDEDKKNPQYIPKRGTFYEHDDRTVENDEINETVETEKTEKEPKKKVWQDKKERWAHDRFNDTDQAPKSRTELIATYGYDIRNEDGPPRARRRRRYGRGPNKYTRNWEDEDAYGKTTVIRKPKKPQRSRTANSEDSSENQIESKNQEPIKKDDSTNEKENNEKDKAASVVQDLEEKSKRPAKPKEQIPPKQVQMRNNYSNQNAHRFERQQPNKYQYRPGTGRVVKPKREVNDSDYRGFTKPRQYRTSHNDPVARNRQQKRDGPPPNRNKNQNVQDLEQDLGKMSIGEGVNNSNNAGVKNVPKYSNQRQGSMPPRLQSEQKGSKRYSSIRQRSLPETPNPPFTQHGNYYGNEYSPSAHTQQQQQPQQAVIPSNTVPQMPPPPPNLPALQPQVPVANPPILQGPPQFAGPFPPAPTFLQPGVAPAPFIQPQTTPIINYVQSQPQYPQTPFQGFQQQFNPVNQTGELYQPQGGITYYSPQEQQATQRTAPPKRAKAAIPIVPPPEHRGRGRTNNHVELLNNEDVLSAPIEMEPKNFEDVSTVTVAQ